MAVRLYAAIECRFDERPDDESLDRLLAELDDGSLVAVGDDGHVWRAYYDSAPARDRALASWAPPAFVASVHAIDVPDEHWAERSQASLGPVEVGAFVVTPPWHAAAQPPGWNVIVINPAMGFGTGHHPSTRRCLSLLQDTNVSGQHVLDAGTGSGVLAIAACRLGAASVVAIDPDADAIDAAADSLQRNGIRAVSLTVGALASLPTHVSGTFDCVLANLTGATLQLEAERLATLVREGGWLIASGIEVQEVDDVAAALARAGWHEERRDVEDGWVGLRSIRQTAPASPTPSTAR